MVVLRRVAFRIEEKRREGERVDGEEDRLTFLSLRATPARNLLPNSSFDFPLVAILSLKMWPFKTQDTQTPSNPIPSSSSDGCPVDHSTRQSWLAQHKASTTATSTPSSTPSSNPVDPSSTTSNSASKFLDVASSSSSPHSSSSSSSSLSTKREVSSIPRFSFDEQQPSSSSSSPPSSSNWVYPSPSQFFQAMSRKAQQNLYDQPKEEDMPIVVPIHNAVNERAWNQLLEWENLWDDTSQQKCGGVKLVSFIGKPKEKTWRAWGREMMG